MAWVALGSNLGDRRRSLDFALRALAGLSGTRLLECSPIYETDPVGPGRQGRYLNAVASLDTALGPRALLDELLSIERSAGRVREGRAPSSARSLDLDLLLFGNRGAVRIDEPGLRVPHPRMSGRAFVLVPLVDLAPDLVHPELGLTMAALLAALEVVEATGRKGTGVDRWEPCRRIPR